MGSPENHIALFSEGGDLEQKIETFQAREGQIQMVDAVFQAIDQSKHSLIEAGTGVGKSFAYLVPILLKTCRGRRAVVSTATIALQEQLLNKDLPQLQKVGFEFKATLAKGRSHYLCEKRFKKSFLKREALLDLEEDDIAFQEIDTLVQKGVSVTRSELKNQISSEAWSMVQSETGLCTPRSCSPQTCSYQRARKSYESSDIIIVNHSLLFSHLSLTMSGAQLLPPFQTLVLDEAHRVPDIATEQFGLDYSNTKVKFFLDRLYSPKGKGFLNQIQPNPIRIKDKVLEIRQSYESFFSDLLFWRLSEAPKNGRVKNKLDLDDRLSPQLLDLADLISNWTQSADTEEEAKELAFHASSAKELAYSAQSFLTMSVPKSAYWIESDSNPRRRKVRARLAPLDIGPSLKKWLFDAHESVICTSATLSTTTGESFDYIKNKLGLDSIPSIQVPSPFNYPHQIQILSTQRLEAPNQSPISERILEAIYKCIQLTQGGVFVLVTSYQSLKKCYDYLYPLSRAQSWSLFAQGLHGSRSSLLESFKNTSNGVLIGTHSFWEGVDVPGPALRNVIIPRLPFEVPDHPLIETRCEWLKQQGKEPFYELTLPQALMKFRQGVGRLIRQVDDIGILCILDSRLHQRSYGNLFRKALPQAPHQVDQSLDPDFLIKIQNWAELNHS